MDLDMTFEEGCEYVINYFGKNNQLDLLQEECAELIQAISKMRRRVPRSELNFVEEVADVKFILYQLESVESDLQGRTDQVMREKLHRTLEIIDTEQNQLELNLTPELIRRVI